MKNITFLFLLLSLNNFAQIHFCAKHKQTSVSSQIQHSKLTANLSTQISHELKYDVKFVHLNLNLERTNKNVSGGVKTIATVTVSSMDTFMVVLHQNHTVDSVRFNGLFLPFVRQDSSLKIKAPTPLVNGTTFTVSVYYHGIAPVGGAAIGNGFSNGTSGSWGNQVTWSLSESIAAYHWWPCKQILTDKIDSSWVFVTTDSANKVGSNGLLKNVVTIGNKKRYEWKSNYPIDYYLISVAIAKYKEYNLYAKPQYLIGDSILIQNYIYDNAINNVGFVSQKNILNKMPQVVNLFSKLFGMYPFYKEKYGHCMAPFGGGMEHQTMTSLGFFDYYVDAHELGHQWWGDYVTCKTWGDIWINEGFASYSEHLTAQYLDPSNLQPNLSTAHSNVMSQNGGSIFFTGNDTMDANRIFDSRLTYDKGGSIIRTLQFVTNNDSLWFNTLRGFLNTYKFNTASAVDFKNYYQTQTGISATQFFNQWYYGEGYPTFNVTYNKIGNTFVLKSNQTTSMPSSVPVFITPMEYKISRTSMSDTIIRVNHNVNIETYTVALQGTVTSVVCDPNNFVINKVVGPTFDPNLIVGVSENQIKNLLITVGPNPFKNEIQISNLTNDADCIELLDVNGKLISKHTVIGTQQTLSINLKTGICFVSIKNKQNQILKISKLIKE
ncbi:MAG: T9SS type A sorting domain-containing protein [Bacteroidetes bacterium]|nr:T9SS type A sorting domain-containing protein [Bacteroidota bacterium]